MTYDHYIPFLLMALSALGTMVTVIAGFIARYLSKISESLKHLEGTVDKVLTRLDHAEDRLDGHEIRLNQRR